MCTSPCPGSRGLKQAVHKGLLQGPRDWMAAQKLLDHLMSLTTAAELPLAGALAEECS